MLEIVADLDVIPDAVVPSHDIRHRKKIGAFYTPLSVSSALSNWGIRSASDLVLEPCFGGCTFLDAAMARLGELGNDVPESNLFGCDIDPLAFSHLKTRIKPATISLNFFEQDFLEFSLEQCSTGKVDLVIGNPPYIRSSNFSAKQRETVSNAAEIAGINIHGRANLWAYFVVHALQFLKRDGRLALVLPGSFLYADYSVAVRKFVHSKFERVTALTLAERLFLSEGTEETTVVLLAEGFGKRALGDIVTLRCVESTAELTTMLENWSAPSAGSKLAYPGHGLVPVEVGQLYNELSSHSGMRTLGEMVSMRIGLVTGDSPYFIKSRFEWKRLNIQKYHLKYIMPRSQFVPGISIDADDCQRHINDDVRCLALWTPSEPRNKHLLKYLNSYPKEKRENNSTYKRRPIWHQFRDAHEIPDAFFVFMADQGPRLILNFADANSTNSMYRVSFHKEVAQSQRRLIALSMCTTFSQLAAEIIGHPRGSGALKLEPSNALKMALLLPEDRFESDINAIFKVVNEKLRGGDAVGARLAADGFLFNSRKLAAALPLLRAGLEKIRSRRIR